MHSPLSIHARCRLADKGDAKAQAIAAVQSAAEANRVASLLESPAKVEPISTAGHRVSRQHVRNAIRKGDAISAAQLTLTLDNQEGGWEAPMLLARLATEGLLEHSLIGTMHLSRALEFQGWNRSATFFPWLATLDHHGPRHVFKTGVFFRFRSPLQGPGTGMEELPAKGERKPDATRSHRNYFVRGPSSRSRTRRPGNRPLASRHDQPQSSERPLESSGSAARTGSSYTGNVGSGRVGCNPVAFRRPLRA